MASFRIQLVPGLFMIGMASAAAPGQVTLLPSCPPSACYVFSESQGTGYGYSGHVLPTLNAPFAAIGDGISSTAIADYSFTTAPGSALLRIDLAHSRSSALGHFASSGAVVAFVLASPLPYELTGEYVYVGDESAHYEVSLYSTGCIYCGVQNMNSPGTATVGTLPDGPLPGGPTSGVLPAGTYSLLLGSFIYANLGQGPAEANGFVQLQLGAVPCPADTDGDGDVGILDFLDVLAHWGPCEAPCPTDVIPDGDVGINDLLALLAAWGPCP